MKIKDDIIKWRNEVRKLEQQMQSMDTKADDYHADVKALKEQVQTLVKITEEMTETLLTLVRQQIGD